MKKSIIKHYIAGQANPIKEAMRVMECRAAEILDGNDWYKELYIDPYVDIVNSHPQVIQQVKNEIRDFLSVLKKSESIKVIDGKKYKAIKESKKNPRILKEIYDRTFRSLK